MTMTEQITTGSGALGPASDRYVSDDWEFSFEFTDSASVALDMSDYTFTAFLIYEPAGVYTSTAMTSTNGEVDSSQASDGIITATVFDALTSTLTSDKDSVDTVGVTPNTRLVLLQTADSITTTVAIMPIRVIRR